MSRRANKSYSDGSAMRADAASGKINSRLTRSERTESLRNRHLEFGTSRRQVPGERSRATQLLIKAAYFHLHVHSEVAPLACFSCCRS